MILFWVVDVGRGAAVTSALSYQLMFYFDTVGQERRNFPHWGSGKRPRLLFLSQVSGSLQKADGVGGEVPGPIPLDSELYLGIGSSFLAVLVGSKDDRKPKLGREVL